MENMSKMIVSAGPMIPPISMAVFPSPVGEQLDVKTDRTESAPSRDGAPASASFLLVQT
jgi:hypothetical protein